MASDNRPKSFSRSLPSTRADAFTLVEVVVAIGVFAVTIVAVIGLLGPVNRSVRGVSDFDKAAQFGDAIQTELVRLRDANGRGGAGLDHVAALIDGEVPLKLVASSDGIRVVHETEATDATAGSGPLAIPKNSRYFLIEISRQPAFAYTSGTSSNRSAFLAMTAVVRWPYLTAGSTAPTPEAQRSSLLLNFALPP